MIKLNCLKALQHSIKLMAVGLLATSFTACPLEIGEDCITDTSTAKSRTYVCHDIDFTVSIPEPCVDGGCGLIADVHGLTMNSEIENKGTNMRWLGRNAMARGAATPYIVIQPNANGLVPSWSEEDDENVYDFMQQAVEAWNIDENRIHMGGFSQGGQMTYRFICKYSDFVVSFAPMAGTELLGCALPTNPVLHIHGRLDPLAPFPVDVGAARQAYTSLMGNFQRETIDEGLLHTHYRYTGNGYQWDLIEHDSVGTVGGHCLPGGWGIYGCPVSSFDVGKETIDFYIAHPQ